MCVEIIARCRRGCGEGVCTVEDWEGGVVKAAVDEKDGGCEVGAIVRGGGGIAMEYQRRRRREKVGENEVEGGGKKGKEMGWSLSGRGF